MILHRTVWAEHIRNDGDIINTALTKFYIGRWDDVDVEVLYTADSPEVAIKERGYHFVMTAEGSSHASSTKAHLPKGWDLFYNQLYERSAYLAQLEVEDDLRILDLTVDPAAANIFSGHGFGHLNTTTYRKDSFVTLRTPEFGAAIEKSGYEGIKVKSARSNEGSCVVIYRKNYIRSVRILGTEKLLFTAVTPNGRFDLKKAPCSILRDQCLVRDGVAEKNYSFLRLP